MRAEFIVKLEIAAFPEKVNVLSENKLKCFMFF